MWCIKHGIIRTQSIITANWTKATDQMLRVQGWCQSICLPKYSPDFAGGKENDHTYYNSHISEKDDRKLQNFTHLNFKIFNEFNLFILKILCARVTFNLVDCQILWIHSLVIYSLNIGLFTKDQKHLATTTNKEAPDSAVFYGLYRVYLGSYDDQCRKVLLWIPFCRWEKWSSEK